MKGCLEWNLFSPSCLPQRSAPATFREDQKMTHPKQLNHIRLLISELEKLQKETPEPEFDMNIWCSLANSDLQFDREQLERQIEKATENPCGTAACLAGKAGLIPAIRKLGFKWAVSSKKNNIGHRDFPAGQFQYKDRRGRAATEEFFGVSVMHMVFESDQIYTLQEGIDALKAFVYDRFQHERQD